MEKWIKRALPDAEDAEAPGRKFNKCRPYAHVLFCANSNACPDKEITRTKRTKGLYYVTCTFTGLCTLQRYAPREIRLRKTKSEAHRTLRSCIGYDTATGEHVACGVRLSRYGAGVRFRCRSCNAKQQVYSRYRRAKHD